MSSHSSAFLALVNEAKADIENISIEDYLKLKKSQTNLVLIDVREQDEWTAGHFPESVYMGKGVIERDIEAKYPDHSIKLVLYCGGGYRSALAAQALKKMGYNDVINLDGGWRRWNELGLPVEK